MWMIFPLPFPRAPTAPTSDYFRQPFLGSGLRLRRERFPSAFLKLNLYTGVLPNRGILRSPPVLPLSTLVVNFSTPPSASIGSATGSRQNTLLQPIFLAGSPSHRQLLLQLNVILLQVQAWLPTSLTAFPTPSFSPFCCMAPTSSPLQGACLQRWRFTGVRFNVGLQTASEPRPPPYWPQRPASPLSLS